ncbi:Tll0287-like domain-containing protein [Leptospira jelokensis]|uniref:Tll0287-like domain-containing protein n=1 Tax=Leptospira jelokensis TaxID=2484931 RepID=UPI0010910F86|nr:DUF3365 domain-containing protein [Leptospira jelokensis]TGL99738.1 DUF3365 domain-containing protein [Leptospira jelokensis]
MKVWSFVFCLAITLYCKTEKLEYEERALQITTEAKTNLSKKLMEAMKEGGTKKAIPFCHENALTFTESLGKKANVELKRISNRPRNPKNALTKEEKEIFSLVQSAKGKDGVFPNHLVSSDRAVTVFVPITIQGQCVQCHGKPEGMEKETKEILKTLYPNDLALGYEVGDLRGLFAVTFKK